MDSKNVSKSRYQNLHAEKCQICGVVFSNPDILAVHKEFVHDYLEKLLHGDTGFKDYKVVKKGWTVIGNATRENLSPNGQDTIGRNIFKEGKKLSEECTTDLRKETDTNPNVKVPNSFEEHNHENVQQKKIEQVHKLKNSNIDDFWEYMTKDTNGRNMFKEGKDLIEENIKDLRKETDKNEDLKVPDRFEEQDLQKVQQEKIEENLMADNFNIDDFLGNSVDKKKYSENNNISNGDVASTQEVNENVKVPDSYEEQNLKNVQQDKIEENHKSDNFNIDNFLGNSVDKKKYSEDNNISNSEVANTQEVMSHLHVLEEHSTQQPGVCMLGCNKQLFNMR